MSINHYYCGMKVIVIDEQHEKDLEDKLNEKLIQLEHNKVLDIKFSTSSFCDEEDQIFSFSALIMYE